MPISEEEKKAIKFLESDKEMLKENYNFGKEAKARIASDIEKGLNIIEKRNKELDNSIGKDKVRDKIEELKKIKTQLPVEHIKLAQIKILQELLEDK